MACGLLELDRGALLFELHRDLSGLGLGGAILERVRVAGGQVLGSLETEGGELAYHLDDLDLLGAALLEDDRQPGLLLSRGGRRRRATASRRTRRGDHGDV